MPPMLPPMIWLRAVFSLRTRPASTAVVMRATRMSPKSSSTRTSTNFRRERSRRRQLALLLAGWHRLGVGGELVEVVAREEVGVTRAGPRVVAAVNASGD